MKKAIFCYFNALPQTVKFNRGIWKKWAEKAKALSKTKRIFILAGTIYNKNCLNDALVIPSHRYKIVVDTKTSEVIYDLLFKNDNSKTYKYISYPI